MSKLAKLIKADGTETVFAQDRKVTLEEAQAAVGGFVEMVRLPHGAKLLVDEEGLLKHKPVNTVASRLAGALIVGDVLLLYKGMGW